MTITRICYKNVAGRYINMDGMTGIEKMERMLAPDMLKMTARMLEAMFAERLDLMYEVVTEETEEEVWGKYSRAPIQHKSKESHVQLKPRYHPLNTLHQAILT